MITRFQCGLFCGIAASTCLLSCASMYMRKLLEDKLFNQNICRLCIDLLQQHKKGVDILGPPLNFRRPNLQNTFNCITRTDASIALLVSGSKTSGNLLIRASKEETDTEWALETLTLEVPKQRVIIKG